MLLAGTALAVLGLSGGCSFDADKDGARDAAEAFWSAVQANEAREACALLAPRTLAQLEESAGKPCEKALPEEDLPTTRVRRVSAFGQTAFVEGTRDTAFLGRFPDGWRITAVGCQEQPRQPYDCTLESG